MSKKTDYTPTEQELKWVAAERDHRTLYATGGHGPWLYCGCPLARFLRGTARPEVRDD